MSDSLVPFSDVLVGLCRGNSFDMLNRPLRSCSNKLSTSLLCTRCELDKLFHFSDGLLNIHKCTPQTDNIRCCTKCCSIIGRELGG